jgi:hypothetical protein
MHTEEDSWDDDISLSNGSQEAERHSSVVGHGQATGLLREMARHIFGNKPTNTSLVAAAVSLGFPSTLQSKTSYKPIRRGGGMSPLKRSSYPPRPKLLSSLHRLIQPNMLSLSDLKESSKTPGASSNPTSTQVHSLDSTSLNKQTSEMQEVFSKSSKVLPESVPQAAVTFYTIRAQLTFGLDPGKGGVNVPALFLNWIQNTSKCIPDFSLLPFDDEKGQQITDPKQAPDENPTFYSQYYSNHRVLQHGNLTGIVHFRCSVPWSKIKYSKGEYFQWLHHQKVYLNQMTFKTDTLVACGFLVGAHPGHLRRDEAEQELQASLQTTPEELPFQLTARTISVPVHENQPERYSFHAVVVETSISHVAPLKEKFYNLGHPSIAKQKFPYTGQNQFVPLLHTKEWTVTKIYKLAQVHVKIINDLCSIFIANLQDIRNVISTDGSTLLRGFLGTTYETSKGNHLPLLHSVHNTS